MFERDKNGWAHAHLLLRMWVAAREAALLLKRMIAFARNYRLGKCFLRAIDEATKAANYLTKSLLPGALRVAGRVVTYSAGVKRAMTQNCQMISAKSRRWGRGVLRLAQALGVAPEKLKELLGPHWAFHFRAQIYAMGGAERREHH